MAEVPATATANATAATGGLQLHRLKVSQLRRFREPYELAGLQPGLNVLAGPNEAGKSTLVRALRAAFFERHRSTSVEDLRPWGEGASASPTVELDFTLDGLPHRLHKSFLARKRCSLQIGGRLLDGAAAEDHLAERFGFGFAAKGASRPELWGIPGLLWVEQGAGQVLDVQPARDHLHRALRDLQPSGAGDALAGVSGELASRTGEAVLQRLVQQRAALLTAGGRPRGAWAEAQQAMAELTAAVQQLDADVARYRADVDQFDRLQQAHAADEAARPWDTVAAELAQARLQQQALAQREQQQRADAARLAHLEQTRRLLDQALASAQQLQTERDRREAQQALAREAAGQADAAAQAHRPLVQAAEARQQAADLRWRQARASAEAAQLRVQALQELQALDLRAAALQAELQRLQTSGAQAMAQRQRLQALQQALAGRPVIAEAELQRLDQAERALHKAEAAWQAVSTRLEFHWPAADHQALAGPDAPSAVRLEQEGRLQPLPREGSLQIDAPARLHFADGGSLRILPGGRDLASRVAERDRCRAEWQWLLKALAVADRAEAEQRAAAAREIAGQVREAEQALRWLAPDGLAALEQAADQQRAALLALAAQRARAAAAAGMAEPADGDGGAQARARTEAGPQPAGPPERPSPDLLPNPPPTQPDVAIGATEAVHPVENAQSDPATQLARLAEGAQLALSDLAHAEAQAAQAEQLARAAQQQQARLDQLAAAARAQREAAEAEMQAVAERWAAPGRIEAVARSHDERQSLQVELEALSIRLAVHQAALQAGRPEIVAQDVVRLERSLQALQQQHQSRREALLVLQSRLHERGAEGLEERRAEQAAALEQARRRAAELQRRAEALDWLIRRIEAERQAAIDRLQAPLQQRLQHYLPLLMPGARLHTDEHLAPIRLQRPIADAVAAAGGARAVTAPGTAPGGEGPAGAAAARASGGASARPADAAAGQGAEASDWLSGGPLEDHSFGAREQLGLVCRMAYADLLQQAGRPTLLILDDVLAHSDAQRLARMKRVLFDAASRHQVLLFTCHPEWWRDMGVPVREI